MKLGVSLLLALILLFVLLTGCTKPVEEKKLVFIEIEKDFYSHIESPAELIINDYDRWETEYRNIYGNPRCGGDTRCIISIPEVDFSKNTVIAVMMGNKPTGGYEIEVTNVTQEGNVIKLFIRRTAPDSSCVLIQSITSPYQIIKTDKLNESMVIEFEYADVTNSCKEASCLASGGKIVTASCCYSASDFPETCSIGACGCSSEYSHDVKTCECPAGCWNGKECEPIEMPFP